MIFLCSHSSWVCVHTSYLEMSNIFAFYGYYSKTPWSTKLMILINIQVLMLTLHWLHLLFLTICEFTTDVCKLPYTFSPNPTWSGGLNKLTNISCPDLNSMGPCTANNKTSVHQIPCNEKIWWRIKFDKFTVGDACIKLNLISINID